MKLGVAIPVGVNVRDCMDCAKVAEESGFDSVWLSDSVAHDIYPCLTAVALNTERIKVGSGVINVFTRRPVTLGIGTATIDEVSNGRFILGLGPNHKPIVEKRFGMKFVKTLQRMRECVEIIRKIVAGETLDYTGQVFRLQNYKLRFQPPRKEIPIYFGTVGPRMLQLAGEIADGLYLTMASKAFIGWARENLKKGSAATGRSIEDIQVALSISCSPGEDVETAKKGLRQRIAAFARLPSFNKALATSGFSKEAEAISGAWSRNDAAGAAASVDDEMLKALTIFGTPSDCRAKLEEWKKAGVHQPVISPLQPGLDPKSAFITTVKALAN